MILKTIQPDWPAPACVKAYTTLRSGGASQPPFNEANLAQHVGDHSEYVEANRAQLKRQLKLPEDPIWIQQTHSTLAVPARSENIGKEADASFTDHTNQVCVVLTADCLPILMCHRLGTHAAAIHAGWRGLANGIIESTLNALNLPPQDLLVWLGPAIGPKYFEVGAEVKEQFLQNDANAEKAFTPSSNQRWLANLYELARLRLNKLGIEAIYGGGNCTYSDEERFFSYRRDQGNTGRMASLIWLTDSQ